MFEDKKTKQEVESNDRPLFTPRYRVRESEGRVTVEVELPGVSREGLDVHLEGRKLSLRGRTRPFETPEGLELVRSEYQEGDYACSFTVPEGVHEESVRACLSNGILTLTLTPTEPNKKSIPILLS